MPTPDIKTVMDSHASELMAVDGVTGVAIGETEDGNPCVLILIMADSEELARKLPAELDGYPVRLMVSGEIRPMTGR